MCLGKTKAITRAEGVKKDKTPKHGSKATKSSRQEEVRVSGAFRADLKLVGKFPHGHLNASRSYSTYKAHLDFLRNGKMVTHKENVSKGYG